jgi:positive regulator of sigma E activity
MIRTGRVVQAENGKLKVCFDRPEMCEKCGACTGHAHKELVELEGTVAAGAQVDVEMPDARIVKASALAYAIPLLGLMAGVFLGQTIFQTDTAAAVGGLIGLGLAWGGLHLADKRLGRRAAWKPRIIAVHEEEKEQKHE